MGRGTAKSRYLIELDGVLSIRASRCSGLELKHTPGKFYEGNKRTPNLHGGNVEPSEVSFQQAHAVNQTENEVLQWLQDFKHGISVERRTFRIIVLEEDGQTPVKTYELINCLPTSFKAEDWEAASSDTHYFNFSVMSEDMIDF